MQAIPTGNPRIGDADSVAFRLTGRNCREVAALYTRPRTYLTQRDIKYTTSIEYGRVVGFLHGKKSDLSQLGVHQMFRRSLYVCQLSATRRSRVATGWIAFIFEGVVNEESTNALRA